MTRRTLTMLTIILCTMMAAACSQEEGVSSTSNMQNERIAYACDLEGNIDICLIDTEGGSFQRLTKKRYQESNPTWSPDGRYLAYESFAGKGDIYALPVPQVPGEKPGRSIRLTKDRAADYDPAWSPDGKWIAFTSDRDGDLDIYLLDVSDGLQRETPQRLQRLTENTVDDRFPSWSPDSRYIVYVSGDGNTAEICVLKIDGSEEYCLTNDEAIDSHPEWSPDGGTIVYHSIQAGMTSHLFMVNASGGEPHQLTDTSFNDWHPDWSADGSEIVFVSYRAYHDGDAEIFTIGVDGVNPRRLTHSPGHDEGPAWSPQVSP